MLNRIYIIIFLLLCLACQGTRKEMQCPVLQVSVNESSRSIDEAFRKIEIIPLDSDIKASTKAISKIRVANDTLFIFDKSLKTLFLFDNMGNYLSSICRVGKSREEYIMLSDFDVTQNSTIIMLDPMGSVLEYDVDGKFISRDELPMPPYNYHHIIQYDSLNFATWSSVDDQSNAVNIINKSRSEIINGYSNNSGVWASFRIGDVFHRYNDDVFYHEALSGVVYKLSEHVLTKAYEWDLGVKLIQESRLNKPIKNRKEHQKIIEDWKNGTIPFSFTRQLQSDNYYCTTIMDSNLYLTTILYNKNNGESIVIGEDNDGIVRFTPELITDDYLLCIVKSRDEDAFREYVKRNMLDTTANIDNDNQILMRLYF